MPTPQPRGNPGVSAAETEARQRILSAAFSAFVEAGYAATTTLEIARRARVSKRDLYALVGNKQEMLLACIHQRARRLQTPVDLPPACDRESLERSLIGVGTHLLSETTSPTVIAVFRLATTEAVRVPEIARALDTSGLQVSRAALTTIMTDAKTHGLLTGRPSELAEQFAGLLWGDLMIRLLLGIIDTPPPRQLTQRARNAAATFLQLHPDSVRPQSGRTGRPRPFRRNG